MFKSKQFNWIPNHSEAHSRILYDFIELPVHRFYDVTLPGELKWTKLDYNKNWMENATQVWMPIIHYNAYAGGDAANFLEFFQGRHRTAVAAENFSDQDSKIVVMIPKKNLREVVSLLDCRIVESIPNFYPDHDGTLHRLREVQHSK